MNSVEDFESLFKGVELELVLKNEQDFYRLRSAGWRNRWYKVINNSCFTHQKLPTSLLKFLYYTCSPLFLFSLPSLSEARVSLLCRQTKSSCSCCLFLLVNFVVKHFYPYVDILSVGACVLQWQNQCRVK